ncbi:hypothetical protein [Aquabacterium sp.]|uniref:hypothetical protein n=1 Tax=Aquabacterium sp. TaxID=1872578 RepID=UPI0035B4D0EB
MPKQARSYLSASPSKTLLALSLAALMPHAHAENIPLSLTLSETLSRDANLFRVAPGEYAVADTVSSTGLKLGLNKSYGRQRYTANIGGYVNRYFDDKQLNNNSYSVDLGVVSEFADKGVAQISGSASQNLARFDVANQNSVNDIKNMQSNSQISGQLSYGGYGAFNPYVSASHFQQGFTQTSSSYQASNQNTYGLGTNYSVVPQLSVGLGGRFTRGTISYDDGYGGQIVDRLRRRDIDLSSNWVATGLSTLYARISATQEKDAYDPNSNLQIADAKTHGLTGEIDWNYTPQGLLSYSISFIRDKGNVGRNYDLSNSLIAPGASYKDFNSTYKQTNENNRLTNTLNAKITWDLSSKFKLNTSAAYSKYHLDQTQNVDDSLFGTSTSTASPTEHSRYTTFSIGGQYQYARWINLYCDIKRIKRTRDAEYTPFNSTVTACTGQFTLNGMN